MATGDFKIICTDRGQHAPKTIQAFALAIPDGATWTVRDSTEASSFDDLMAISERNRGSGVTGRSVAFAGKGRLYCRVCKRDPRPSDERLRRDIESALSAERDTLDISYAPY
jgi:hypothetical protein